MEQQRVVTSARFTRPRPPPSPTSWRKPANARSSAKCAWIAIRPMSMWKARKIRWKTPKMVSLQFSCSFPFSWFSIFLIFLEILLLSFFLLSFFLIICNVQLLCEKLLIICNVQLLCEKLCSDSIHYEYAWTRGGTRASGDYAALCAHVFVETDVWFGQFGQANGRVYSVARVGKQSGDWVGQRIGNFPISSSSLLVSGLTKYSKLIDINKSILIWQVIRKSTKLTDFLLIAPFWLMQFTWVMKNLN